MRIGRIIVFCIIIGSLVLFSYIHSNITGDVVEEYEKEEAYVTEVIDGDTIKTDIGTIRLLGINTPERGNYLYEDAKNFLMQIENHSIEILRDYEDEGKYDRKLRYVYFEDELINIDILEKGLGTAFMTNDLKYEAKLLRAENFARENEEGLWERSILTCSSCIYLKELNAEDEYFILENNCDLNCDLSEWSVKDASRNKVSLDIIQKYSEKKFPSPRRIWNNDGDSFFLRDRDGKLVIYFSYK